MQHIKNLSNLIIPELERLPVASKKSGDADDTPPSHAKQSFSNKRQKNIHKMQIQDFCV
jgi:hypothetical protein